MWIWRILGSWLYVIEVLETCYYLGSRCVLLDMEISTTRFDRIVTHIGGIPIEFDVEDLNNILGILDVGRRIYTSRKALSFADFAHNFGV